MCGYICILYFSTEEIMSLCHRFVMPTIGEDWRFLAMELFPSIGQADKAINAITYEQRSNDLKDKARRVITRWQQECGLLASFPVLLTALSHIARNDIIHKFNVGKCEFKTYYDNLTPYQNINIFKICKFFHDVDFYV